jgi:hypothetical protein
LRTSGFVRGGAMGLKMGGVDYDPLRLAALMRQGCEDLVEYVQAASSI